MELIAWIAGAQLHKRCNFEGNSCTGSVMKVADTGMALLHRSSEKNWQLLTKFIINSHLTVEEKICHKK